MQTIANMMSGDPISVVMTESLEGCRKIMRRHGFRHLPVVEGTGRLAGVITDDVVQVLLRHGRHAQRVSEVATEVEIVARPGDCAIHTLTLLLVAGQDAVIAVDRTERPVGIFTEHDALELADVSVRPWLTVGDVVRRGGELCTVSPDALVDEAAMFMSLEGIRHLLVVEDHQLVGVLALRDVLGRTGIRCGSLVQPATWTARKETPLHAAVRLMIREKIGCLPVVAERRRPVGVLTRSDVLRELLGQLVRSSKPPAPTRVRSFYGG